MLNQIETQIQACISQIQNFITSTETSVLIWIGVGVFVGVLVFFKLGWKLREKIKLKRTIFRNSRQIDINFQEIKEKVQNSQLSKSEKHKYISQIEDDQQAVKYMSNQQDNYRKLRKIEEIQKRHKEIKTKLKNN